ncbi:MAG: TatD family hydrolase [Akkermansiaceae bacterium]|nr:TatD family hydrolase [Akkermansiaceae bacterium]
MTDAHNHLQDTRFDGIRDQVIAGMMESGITRCVVNGTSPADWPRVAALAKTFPEFIIPSFGLHPWQTATDGWLELLVDYLGTVPGACVGECGLDRWMRGFDIDLQTEVFTAQLNLAADRNLPLSIHCLKAWGPLLGVLESNNLPDRGFLLHSYGGSAELVPRFAELGAYFSFSGYFLHEKKAGALDAFRAVPAERLLLESDAPDMLPPAGVITHPLPDGANHPANLPTIAEAASACLDTTRVDANFSSFFGI